MAGTNPFADPVNNPFSDPSVQAAARTNRSADDGFNPFAAEVSNTRPAHQVRGAGNPPPHDTLPPPYTQSAANAPTSEQLLRQQEELERKAQEIRRREEELSRRGNNVNNNNWPPLPTWCPVRPCFYQDIGVEIPPEFQRLVRLGYYLWLIYVVVLFVNVWGSMAYFVASKDGVQFGVSILQFLLFTPCSFVLWFRPMYKGFRSDSSMNFMVFFFVVFLQLIFVTVQALGFTNFGTCGWINSIGAFTYSVGVGIFMLLIAVGFTFCGLSMLLLLFRVHRLYRSTGASASRAQQEFTHGVISNQHVQQAAVGVASTAVRQQFSGQGPNRY